jgi:hypothetical protein
MAWQVIVADWLVELADCQIPSATVDTVVKVPRAIDIGF